VAIKEYRERYALIAQILSDIRNSGTEGASRTSIMFNCFLSYAQLREYLSFLTEKELINEFPQQFKIGSRNVKYVYKITEKGLRLLQISQEIKNLVGLY
jgi:predicted transcriptional regulator